MAANDATVDQVFQDWDDQKVKLHAGKVEERAAQLGPWAKLVGQRLQLFAERWRPDHVKVMKRLGSNNNASADQVRGHLTPMAREDFVADLRAWGVPDRFAHAAGSLVEVK
jgi:hypothetical protein